MSYKTLVRKLVKSDRRVEWKALKAKHRAALAAKKVDFGAGLGPALDKYQPAVKAVTKLFAAEKLSQPALQKVLDAARPLGNIAQHYLGQVKGLGNPAGKELTAFLKALITESEGWEQVSDMFEQTIVPTMSRAQLSAVKDLYGALDRLMAQLENMGKSLPAARADVKAGAGKIAKPTIKPVKQSGAEWQTLNALSPKVYQQLVRAKAAAIVAGYDRLIPAHAAAQRDAAPLMTAVVKFTAQSDYAAFKLRAQSVAAGALPAFIQEAQSFLTLQADPELLSRLGLEKGLPVINNGRASIAVKHGSGYAQQVLDGIRRLP